MYAMQNDIEQALTYYNNAYLLYQSLNSAAELVKVCARLGDLYVKQGKKETADRFYTKILAYKSDLLSSPVVQLRNNNYNHITMANYFLHFALYDSLIQYYQEQMPHIIRYNLAADKAYENIGLAHEQKGDFDKAIIYIQRTLKYAQKNMKRKEPRWQNIILI